MNALGSHPALLRGNDAGKELCQLVGDYTGRVIGNQVVEPKLDGIRALWLNGELVTREGAPIHGAEHIAARLRWLESEACVPMMFDGEWVVAGSFAATLAHFQARGGNGDAGTLHLFDALPMSVWRGEECCHALEVRKTRLDAMLAEKADAAVRPMPWAYLANPDPMEIEARAREFIAAGAEGIVTKQAGAVYQRKLGTVWQRIKKALTLDLTIVGYEADRARPWLLGVLIVDHGGVKVRVRAGFSDTERLALLCVGDGLIGQVAEIEAVEVTERGSLRSARWLRMRADKRMAR